MPQATTAEVRLDQHKAASFSPAGRASCRFGFKRVGCDRISLPRNPQGRKIATNNFGIREMSVESGKMEAQAPLRKPLALVFCDIAGFTHLMAQEGDLVASAFLREFYEHTGRLGRKHRSLMIKFIADGFLAAFEHVDDVMPFVISVESLLSENPTFVGRSLGFKFSLHYGNALYIETSYGSDIFGEDVNVAAHLNDLAQPNEIVVSQAALDRMPTEYRARAGASESRQFKRVGDVEFRRLNLVAS